MKRLRAAFAIILTFIIFVTIALLYRNAERMVRKKTTGQSMKPGAELSFKSPRFVETRGTEKILEVQALEAHYFKESSMAELKEPIVVIYGKDERRAYVRGEKGLIDTETNDVELDGNASVDLSDEFHISAGHLKYFKETMTIATEDKVRISGQGFQIDGKGMKVRLDTEKIYLYGSVNAVFDRSFQTEYGK